MLETGEGPLVKITARPEGGPASEGIRHRDGGLREALHVLRRAHHAGPGAQPRRPRSSSRRSAALAAAGCREVTLLGQTVNAYGRDLDPPTDLAALLERVNDIDGIERIRFTTSNPYNLTPRLIRALRDVPKVCEYLHLPLQSGSDRVLERMNRGYTRARYLELIAELQETVPDLALSTDLIVGFPGETEDDFARTVEMVERVAYDNVFAFRYSRRPGTPAAEMDDQVPEEVKARPQPPHPGHRDPRGRGAQPASRRPNPARPGRRGLAQERGRGGRAHPLQSSGELRSPGP